MNIQSNLNQALSVAGLLASQTSTAAKNRQKGMIKAEEEKIEAERIAAYGEAEKRYTEYSKGIQPFTYSTAKSRKDRILGGQGELATHISARKRAIQAGESMLKYGEYNPELEKQLATYGDEIGALEKEIATKKKESLQEAGREARKKARKEEERLAAAKEEQERLAESARIQKLILGVM